MAQQGGFLKERRTGEVVMVTDADDKTVSFAGLTLVGQIAAEAVSERFDVMDPTTQEDVEAVLKLKVTRGEAETGLYGTGLSYVVVDEVNGEITFQWFSHMESFQDTLNVGLG